MISIIISSNNKLRIKNLLSNIKDTIGIDIMYEIIDIWNPGLMGICAAYNKGAEMAQYPYLLFLHDDVEFVTINWGQILINTFKIPNVGLVGLAGSIYKPNIPSAWWCHVPIQDNESALRFNIIQVNQKKIDHNININPFNEKNSEVVCLDGVFLAIEKNKFQSCKFDEALVGFHGYDLDISIAMGKKYKNLVNYEILLKHYSGGKVDINWLNAMLMLQYKWQETLPTSTVKLNEEQIVEINNKTFYQLLDRLKSFKIDKFTKFKYLIRILRATNNMYKLKKLGFWIDVKNILNG